MADEAPRQFEIDLPPEAVPGSYADFANVWHTPDVFVMDFVSQVRPSSAAFMNSSVARTLLFAF